MRQKVLVLKRLKKRKPWGGQALRFARPLKHPEKVPRWHQITLWFPHSLPLGYFLTHSLSLSLLLTSISWPLVGQAQLIQIFCFSIFKTQNYCSNSAKLSLLVVRICWSSVKKIWAEFWRESFAQKLTNFKERVWRKFVEAPGPTGHVSFSRRRRRRCDSDCDSANSHHFQ